MLVTRSTFAGIVESIASKPGWYQLDTETTGLNPYKGARVFSIIVGRGEELWYFNFIPYAEYGLTQEAWLLPEHIEQLQRHIFSSPDHHWELHNAKFDMHQLGCIGIELAGSVFCTYAIGRLVHNDLHRYSLDYLGERWLGEKKSDAVIEYCEEHRLYDVEIKGKRKKKNYHFARVPLGVVQPYAERDVFLTGRLAAFEREKIATYDEKWREPRQAPLAQVVANEMALTKVLFEMERVGIQLDKAYTEKALASENARAAHAAEAFKQLTGEPLEADKPTTMARAFGAVGLELPKNAAGRSLINKDIMAKINHPIVELVSTYRQASKRAVAYYANFLAMADEQHVIHPDFHQGGTKTGRLSCRDPNLQNLSRPDEDGLSTEAEDQEDVFEVRRAFIPREDFVLFCPDYSQIEYRVMLDYAQELELIELVKQGVCVHTATAQKLGVTRYQAKTINFMLLYGGGIAKLAAKLNCDMQTAKLAREQYFAKLPHVANFIERVRAKAADKLTIYNWFGRRYVFANPDMTYTAGPNWLVQGGCAEILKRALIACHEFLQQKKARSRIVLNVHDEIPFELHKNELDLAPELVRIMERQYPYHKLPLAADPAYSWRSLADKKKGYPELSTTLSA